MTNNSIQLDSGGSYLFVGNSFTFGRVDPVMSYNSDNVRDLTAPAPGTTFANTSGSNPYEPHPWGGVPGIFQAFADQAGLELDVAISARNAATLQGQYLNSNPAGWDLRGNVASQSWDVVVLQDNSTQALPSGAGSITFAAGSSTATLTIHPTADTKVETDETIGLQITPDSTYRTSAGVVSGTILNDDSTGPVVNPALPTVTLVASPGAVLEDGTQKLVYTFTRTGSTTAALTVNFAAARDGSTAPSVATGGDFENNANQFTTSFQANTGQQTTGNVSFTSNTGSVVIPAGASSVTFTLDPRPDATVENDESISLALSANANYNVGTQGAVSVTILNDDFAAGTNLSLPNISLNLAASAVYEDGSGDLVYVFTRTGSNTAALTVNFGVSGSATLPGNDFTVTGANSFSTPGAADPNLQSFNTYAVKLAQYATTGAADGAVPANPHANSATDVYLYETWARPNMVTGAHVANTDDTTGAVTTTTTTAPEYYLSLEAMTADLRAAYEGLAAANPVFAGVAPVGAAFLAAVQAGTATRDPYAPDAGTDGKVDLWWDDNLHASKYGSYLSGLTLFGTLTGLDPRSLGAAEHVASDLGITQAEAAALQNVAAATLGFTLDAHWTAPGQVTELIGGAAGLLATEGSFGFSDSDVNDTHTIAVTALTPGSVGTFTAGLHTDTTGDGTGGSVDWLFTVDNATVGFVAPGESRVEHFLVTISDANGGVAQRDIAVTINGTYNDAPTATNLTQSLTFAEDAATLGLFTLAPVIADIDSATVTATLTLSNVGAGVLTGAGTGAAGVYTITGTSSAVTAALAAVKFDSAQDFNGTASVTVAIDDGHSGPQGTNPSGVVSINVTPVNDAPVNTLPTGALSTPGGVDLAIVGMSVSDVDSAQLTTTLHVDHGTLTVAAIGGAIVSGSGTATVLLTGSVAQIDAALSANNNVLYHSAAGFVGTDHLSMTSSDGGAGGVGGLGDIDAASISVTSSLGFDFDGNGKSDVLLVNDNGGAAIWDNGQTVGAHTIADRGSLSNGWHFAASGDFDGNGKSDILWINNDGRAAIWDDGQATGGRTVAGAGSLSNGWHFGATGDFDGNGKSDVLVVNDNGGAAIWDNGQATSARTIADAGALSNGWHAAGAGDFDGNGKSDILWVNNDGRAAIWDNGQAPAGHTVAGAGSLSNGWHFAATGNFDGNGTSDILWINDNGAAMIWDNGQATSGHSIGGAGSLSNGWHAAGAGDFDGNGKSDILWVNDDGRAAIWDNGQATAGHTIAAAGTVGNGWHIA